MAKILYILKEIFYMVQRHKIYFLVPIFISLALLTLLVIYIGPSVIIAFIYAGI